MSDQTTAPAPGPTGYQPSQGEGFTSIEIEVFPSWGYQKVAIRGVVQFPQPRSYTDVLPAIEEAYAALEEEAAARVDRLVALRDQRENTPAPAPAPAPQQQVTPQQAHDNITSQLGGQQIATQQAGGLPWQQGSKPNNKGTLRFIPSSTVATDRFKKRAAEIGGQHGIPADQTVVFDDRVGQYGLEGGNTAYSAGKIKAAEGSQLKQAMGDRAIVAYVDFADDGDLEVNLSKDGRSALQAVQMAQQMAGQQQPQQPAAPHPAAGNGADVPF